MFLHISVAHWLAHRRSALIGRLPLIILLQKRSSHPLVTTVSTFTLVSNSATAIFRGDRNPPNLVYSIFNGIPNCFGGVKNKQAESFPSATQYDIHVR